MSETRSEKATAEKSAVKVQAETPAPSQETTGHGLRSRKPPKKKRSAVFVSGQASGRFTEKQPKQEQESESESEQGSATKQPRRRPATERSKAEPRRPRPPVKMEKELEESSEEEEEEREPKKRTKQPTDETEQAEQAASGKLLAELATPRIFEGPKVKLVKTIADKLEDSAVKLDKEKHVKERRDIRQAHSLGFQEMIGDILTADDPALLARATEENERAKASLPVVKYRDDINPLYIGSIRLTEIPPKGKDQRLFKTAKLTFDPDHAFPMQGSAVDLPKHAKVERDVIRLVLQTMINAGQLDYLRESGIVGGDWAVVVEVHYYRSRKKTQNILHKDTYGQTLFVNLNYANTVPMPGPEWIVNPPLVGTHEERIEEALPPQFIADLKTVRGAAPAPTVIETETLPPYGVVSFVDEAIHHATPLLGHRQVTVGNLRDWLTENDEAFAATFARTTSKGGVNPLEKGSEEATRKTAAKKRRKESEPEKKERGKARSRQALVTLCEGADTKTLTRPDLQDAGMADAQIDRLLSEVGESFREVSIPKLARKDKKTQLELMRSPGQQKPIILQRRMSELALKKQLPVDPGGERRFFRTWVRVVRKEPASPPPAPTKKPKKREKDED